jgi:uncharacterized MAPEG superfamily protein
MVLIVLLVLALFVLQTLLPGRFHDRTGITTQELVKASLGPRDQLPPLTPMGRRSARALSNMQEALPVFLALALMNMIVAPSASLAVTGATLFLVARAVYVAVYLAGIPVVRTLVWIVGWIGLGMMIVPLLNRI